MILSLPSASNSHLSTHPEPPSAARRDLSLVLCAPREHPHMCLVGLDGLLWTPAVAAITLRCSGGQMPGEEGEHDPLRAGRSLE